MKENKKTIQKSIDKDEEQIQSIIGLGKFSARKSYFPELRKKMDELQEEKLKYERIFTNALHGIFQVSLKGEIIVVNPSMVRICGYATETELLSLKNANEELFVDGYDFIKLKVILNESGSVSEFETHFKKKDGQHICVSINASLQNLNSKEYIECFVHDITERKIIEKEKISANKALRESEIQFRTLFEKSPVPLYENDFSEIKNKLETLKKSGIKDLHAHFEDLEKVKELVKCVRIINVNKAALELNQAKNKAELSALLPKVYGEQNLKQFKNALIAISENKLRHEFEDIITTIKGDQKIARTTWAVVPGFEKTYEKVYLTTIDISKRKKIESELIRAKEKAEKADKLKSAFLAQMSHEIRTPINAMLSLSSLLKDELDEVSSNDQRLSFELISKAGNRIVRTVDLLLNLSEIQTGTYEPIIKEFDLYTDIIGKLAVEFKSFAKEKNLNLKILLETRSFELIADSYTVNQIFEQLIDNAIKYTNQGEITIKIFRNNNERLSVEIKDTGIGISEEFIPEIFDAFSQEETGYSRRYEGSGIGLNLVKNYCSINNAEIELETVKGKGSTFRVIFLNS